jgi:ribosomal protein L22
MENFSDLFDSEEFGTYQPRKSSDKTLIGRNKVVALLERSKALFLDPNYTYLKHREYKKPLACFAVDSDNRYSVRVIYARSTVTMPNGFDCIYCTKDRVPEIHDLLANAVKNGHFDKQLKEIQIRISKPITVKE